MTPLAWIWVLAWAIQFLAFLGAMDAVRRTRRTHRTLLHYHRLMADEYWRMIENVERRRYGGSDGAG